MAEAAKKIQTSYPYWMSMYVGLTGGAGQRKTGTTPAATTDVRLLGGQTNLSTSKVRVADFGSTRYGESGPLQMQTDVALVTMFGKRDGAHPIKYWGGRYLHRSGQKLRAEVLNVGGESGGYLVFVGRPERGNRQQIDEPEGRPQEYIVVSAGLDGTAEKTTQGISVGGFDHDLLFTGALTDMAAASIGIRIVDHAGAPWCDPNSYVPLWAVAGRASGDVPCLRWPVSYFLPRGEYIQVGFQNALAADTPESNGTVTFEAVRLS
jgi:hypothetical protein